MILEVEKQYLILVGKVSPSIGKIGTIGKIGL